MKEAFSLVFPCLNDLGKFFVIIWEFPTIVNSSKLPLFMQRSMAWVSCLSFSSILTQSGEECGSAKLCLLRKILCEFVTDNIEIQSRTCLYLFEQ